MLKTIYQYKLTIQDFSGSPHEADLRRVVASVSVRSRAEAPDLRWGMILVGPDSSDVREVFLDAAGTAGVFDGKPVSIRGDLGQWLHGRFGKAFK